MLNIGPGELIMICVIALIVLGPDKLPQAMRTAGQVMNQMRRMSNGFQQDIAQAFQEETASDRHRPSLTSSKGNGDAPAEVTESSTEEVLWTDEVDGTVDAGPVTDRGTGVDEVVTSAGDDGTGDEDADGNPRVA